MAKPGALNSSRFQFSIMHLMMLAILVACILMLIRGSHATSEVSRLKHEIRTLTREHRDQLADLRIEYGTQVSDLKQQLDRLRHIAGIPDTSDPKRVTFILHHATELRGDTYRFRVHIPDGRTLAVCAGVVMTENDPLPLPLHLCQLAEGKGVPPFYPTLREFEVRLVDLDERHFAVELSGDIKDGPVLSKPVPGSCWGISLPKSDRSSSEYHTVFPSDRRQGLDTPAVLMRQSISPQGWLVLWLNDDRAPPPMAKLDNDSD